MGVFTVRAQGCAPLETRRRAQPKESAAPVTGVQPHYSNNQALSLCRSGSAPARWRAPQGNFGFDVSPQAAPARADFRNDDSPARAGRGLEFENVGQPEHRQFGQCLDDDAFRDLQIQRGAIGSAHVLAFAREVPTVPMLMLAPWTWV